MRNVTKIGSLINVKALLIIFAIIKCFTIVIIVAIVAIVTAVNRVIITVVISICWVHLYFKNQF